MVVLPFIGGAHMPSGLVGEEEVLLVLRERSKMRSFFSAPPVARTCGRGWAGKATARTMCACWRVCRHSPVWVSQTLLWREDGSAWSGCRAGWERWDAR